MDKLLSRAGRHFLLGNEAIVRGALEAGVSLVSCYPGTPSSEVADTFLRLSRQGDEPAAWRMEYSTNEKVALEVGAGCALAGGRSLVCMKHVGLNVAADPLFTSAYIGLPGGLVILSADDPGCHSSQNEQDNRAYARFAGLPCFEPATPQEAADMTRAAFELAAGLETPVLLRTTTRVSHMRGPVDFSPLPAGPHRKGFERNPGRFVPVPAVARKRHRALASVMREAAAMAGSSPFQKLCGPADSRLGIVASGPARNYLADALGETGLRDVAVLELGLTWPLPEKLLADFMRAHPRVLVLEEGAPLLEDSVRALAQRLGIATDIEGKDDGLTEFGEYSASLVAQRLARFGGLENFAVQSPRPASDGLPGRPPNLCPGCSHRSVYYAARKVFGDDAIYSSDIGCYTLGLLPPLKTADFLVCMGSSVSAGSGFACVSEKPVVAFIGDSTFFHSGMTGLANAVFNRHDLLLVILDNGTTAMTGHQPNPGMDESVLGDFATRLDIEAIVGALGVTKLKTVPANNLAAVTAALRELAAQSGPRVFIAREPCVLHARRALKKGRKRVAYVARQGEEAERCLRELACPAFTRVDGEMAVDPVLCSGCMLCLQIAPGAFKARKAE